MSVSICLKSRFPMVLWWGPEFIMLYNDAWRPVLGETKHPGGLGRPGVNLGLKSGTPSARKCAGCWNAARRVGRKICFWLWSATGTARKRISRILIAPSSTRMERSGACFRCERDDRKGAGRAASANSTRVGRAHRRCEKHRHDRLPQPLQVCWATEPDLPLDRTLSHRARWEECNAGSLRQASCLGRTSSRPDRTRLKRCLGGLRVICTGHPIRLVI